MKLPFATKYNGIFYPAFTEIPVDETEVKAEVKAETVEETKKQVEIPRVMQEETLIEKLAKEEKVKMDIPKFKKTEIQRMNKEYIMDLAKRLKIKGYEDMSANKLKDLIYKLSVENNSEEE